MFASARMLGFSCSASIICILKTKTDIVSRMGNWETLGRHARAVNVSGKMLSHFVDVY